MSLFKKLFSKEIEKTINELSSARWQIIEAEVGLQKTVEKASHTFVYEKMFCEYQNVLRSYEDSKYSYDDERSTLFQANQREFLENLKKLCEEAYKNDNS